MVTGSGPPRRKPLQTARQMEEQENAVLAAARDAFPGWDFYRKLDGWIAVPAGTPLIQSSDLEGVIAKLRERG